MRSLHLKTNLSSAVKFSADWNYLGERKYFSVCCRTKGFNCYPLEGKIWWRLYCLSVYCWRLESRMCCLHHLALLLHAVLSNTVTWCFVLIFPARRMLMMFTSAWRINYWLLSASPSSRFTRLNKQVTHCRSELRRFLLLLCEAWCSSERAVDLNSN